MKLNRNFSLLLLGQSLANIGDVLYIVSVISTIFLLTGSAIAASFVPFTIASSMFISSLLTPLLVEKLNLKWLLAGSQIAKTILLFILGFMVMGMWFVGSSLLLIMSSQQLIWLVGCLFVLASLLLSLLENVNSHESTETKGKLEKMKEGWQTLSNTPVLKRIAWIEFLETIAATVWIAAILYVFVSDALNVDEKWWGFINGANFLGLILGSAYCIKFSSVVEEKIGAYIFVGSFASFIFTMLFSINSIPMISLLLSLCVGLFGQIKQIPQQTVIQTSVSKEQLSTVYTSLGAIGTGIFGIGSLVMGVIADLVGIRMVFVISGLLLATVSVIAHKNKQLFVRNVLKP